MPRRSLVFQPDRIYHLYNRGNARHRTFYERENYLHFLRLIRKHLVERTSDVLAYCLMPNHYHLLVWCRTDNVSGSMQRLSVAYTKAMNRRYDRVGALFQGQFQAIEVDSDEYLAQLVRYIHLNPVKARLVSHPRDWEFSSYLEYAGLRGGTLPRTEVLRQQFKTEAEYQAFLNPAAVFQQPLFSPKFASNLQSLLLDE